MTPSNRHRPLFRPMRRDGDTIHIEGVAQSFQVVDDAAAEKVEFVVCMRLAGNERNRALVAETVLGFCSRCNEPVYWSATAPKTPARLCMVCFAADEARHKDRAEPPEYAVTNTVLAECDRAEKIVQRAAESEAQSRKMLLALPKPAKTRMN